MRVEVKGGGDRRGRERRVGGRGVAAWLFWGRCGCRGSSGTGNVGDMTGSGWSPVMLVLLIRVGAGGLETGDE